MALKCKPDVAAARAQTERMLKEAEKAIGATRVHERPALGAPPEFKPAQKAEAPRSAEHCASRLASAKVAYEAAGAERDPLAQRDGYIRAAFPAGQALSCARVSAINKKLGHMPAPKAPKAKKAKAK